MANDYFNASTTLTKHTLARSAQVNSIFQSVAAGLDKLPDADPLNQGRVTYVADTGSADAYVVALSKVPSSYVAGLSIVMKATNANTGASTVNVNSLGVKTIKRYDGIDLVVGDILAGALIHLVYDGTNFRIVGANGAESALAKEWATKTGSTVDGTGYSAKAHAESSGLIAEGSSKEWASKTGGAVASSEHSAKSWAQETGGNAPTAGSAKEWATVTGVVDGGLKGSRGYAQDASASASAAESHYNTFQGIFYGALASDPATDPNGDPPGAGDWYFNTTTNTSRQYDGDVWGDVGSATLSTFAFTATGGETSLSGSDDNGNTLAYTVDFTLVNLNGVLLTSGDDYTATDGTSITGLSALNAGDVVVINAFSRFSISNIGKGEDQLPTNADLGAYVPAISGTDNYSADFGRDVGDGETIHGHIDNANTGTTPTLENTGGTPSGAKTITTRDGSALWAGALQAGVHRFERDETADTWLLLDPAVRHRIEHVKDHGAAVDGTTNDTVKLQAALNAAANRDGYVYGPGGTHLLGAITIPMDVVLELSPYAVIKPVPSFSGDLITLNKNAVFTGGRIDCTGQSFSGNVWVFDPTPNVVGDSKRLVRAVRNTSADGDSGVGTGQAVLLSSMNDGDGLYRETIEGVKGEGFENFIRMEADNPGAGQTGYVNSCTFLNVWCNGPVRGLSQGLNAGDIDANQFIDFVVQWQAATQRALLIDGRYQKFSNQQIWDAAPSDTAIELAATAQLNHIDGYLGDGLISDSGSNNSAVDTRSSYRYAKVQKASFTHDFGSIGAGGRGFTDQNIGIGDGSQGDFCVVQPRTALDSSLIPSSYLGPAAGEVRYMLYNASGVTIDPSSTTFDVFVFSTRIGR